MYEIVIEMLFLELGDTLLGDRSYQYLTTDDMKMLADDSISPIKVPYPVLAHACLGPCLSWPMPVLAHACLVLSRCAS